MHGMREGFVDMVQSAAKDTRAKSCAAATWRGSAQKARVSLRFNVYTLSVVVVCNPGNGDV